MRKPASGREHEQGGIKKGAERPSKGQSGTELTEAHHPYWKKLDESECTFNLGDTWAVHTLAAEQRAQKCPHTGRKVQHRACPFENI